MLTRQHLISGAATLVAVGSGLYLMSRSGGSGPLSDACSTAARNIAQGMGGGHPAFSIHGLLCLALYMFGNIAPDADSESSVIGRVFHLDIGHRTWLHSLWPVAALMLASSLFQPLSWLGAGWFCHLFWDSLSRQGICWFYPYPGFVEYESGAKVKRGNHVWVYKTGKQSEYVVTFFVCVVAVALGWMALRQGIIS